MWWYNKTGTRKILKTELFSDSWLFLLWCFKRVHLVCRSVDRHVYRAIKRIVIVTITHSIADSLRQLLPHASSRPCSVQTHNTTQHNGRRTLLLCARLKTALCWPSAEVPFIDSLISFLGSFFLALARVLSLITFKPNAYTELKRDRLRQCVNPELNPACKYFQWCCGKKTFLGKSTQKAQFFKHRFQQFTSEIVSLNRVSWDRHCQNIVN